MFTIHFAFRASNNYFTKTNFTTYVTRFNLQSNNKQININQQYIQTIHSLNCEN